MLGRAQPRTVTVLKGLGHLMPEERLSELGLFSPQQRRLGGIWSLFIRT